jgi:hypothetical protein
MTVHVLPHPGLLRLKSRWRMWPATSKVDLPRPHTPPNKLAPRCLGRRCESRGACHAIPRCLGTKERKSRGDGGPKTDGRTRSAVRVWRAAFGSENTKTKFKFGRMCRCLSPVGSRPYRLGRSLVAARGETDSVARRRRGDAPTKQHWSARSPPKLTNVTPCLLSPTQQLSSSPPSLTLSRDTGPQSNRAPRSAVPRVSPAPPPREDPSRRRAAPPGAAPPSR